MRILMMVRVNLAVALVCLPAGTWIVRVRGLPLADEGLGQLTGNRVLLTGTAFDDQNAGHGL